jgi:hypothetical protein
LKLSAYTPAVKKDEIIKYMSAFVEKEFIGELGIKMSAKHFVVVNVF